MDTDKFVLTVDEDTQGLIINSLLLMREKNIEEGADVSWISDVILDMCNAPKKKPKFKGEAHER